MSIENGNLFKKETDSDGLTPEQRAIADLLIPAFKEDNISESERSDCEEKVNILEIRFTVFETVHSLEELNKIVNLTPDEAPKHPRRERARLDLIPIVEVLNALKKTNISEQRYDELTARYVVFSKAVGMINNNMVRH